MFGDLLGAGGVDGHPGTFGARTLDYNERTKERNSALVLMQLVCRRFGLPTCAVPSLR